METQVVFEENASKKTASLWEVELMETFLLVYKQSNTQKTASLWEVELMETKLGLKRAIGLRNSARPLPSGKWN